MNSLKPQTHGEPPLHSINTHSLARQQTSQETKTRRLSDILPTVDNVFDSDMSQRLEYVHHCFKFSTIEEAWITKMWLGRDEWSRLAGWILKSSSDCSNYQWMHYPLKLKSQAWGLFTISDSQSRGVVVIYIPFDSISYGSGMLCPRRK